MSSNELRHLIKVLIYAVPEKTQPRFSFKQWFFKRRLFIKMTLLIFSYVYNISGHIILQIFPFLHIPGFQILDCDKISAESTSRQMLWTHEIYKVAGFFFIFIRWYSCMKNYTHYDWLPSVNLLVLVFDFRKKNENIE